MMRIAVFAGLWWVVSGGAAGSWVLGAPAAMTAAYVSWRLRGREAARLSACGLARFAAFFVRESVRGGVDVAVRALAPGGRVRPGYLRYRTALPSGLPRTLFTCAVSLLPGTLSVELEGDELLVHTLDVDGEPAAGLRACEAALRRALPEHGRAAPEHGHA